jgi:hypothetical protein
MFRETTRWFSFASPVTPYAAAKISDTHVFSSRKLREEVAQTPTRCQKLRGH